ncbi:hypothetical protein [Ferrimicrobium sp.]|uniref:hypothetical protein n=1 Tax=Ferrimicrobium sp. TaxID=2926050 RepID=UPI00262F3B4F|nr:hypothetical protein [Ferrimicrobium sp.]
MNDEPRTPGQLCYPGKRIELHFDGQIVVTAVIRVDGQRLGVGERVLSVGPCQVMVVFFGERFLATGVVIPAIVGSEVVIESGFVPMNARSAPRVNVVLAGTYYTRPPSVGIPMQVLDLSVTGVAIEPIPKQHPLLSQRQMISFHLGDREIKTVIEFVAVEVSLWRARFLKLALSDEDAIAMFVMSRQVDRRKSLSDLEIRTSSSLDLETRLEFPLIESISWSHEACTLRTGSSSATVMVPPSPQTDRDRIVSLVGTARVGDPRDFAHLLGLVTMDIRVIDSVMVAYLVLSARYKGISVVELLLSYAQGREDLSVTTASTQFASLTTNSAVADPSSPAAPTPELVGYSCGIAVYRGVHNEEFVPATSPPEALRTALWMDPIALVLLVQQLVSVDVRPAWPTLTAGGDGKEVLEAFVSLAASGSAQPRNRQH